LDEAERLASGFAPLIELLKPFSQVVSDAALAAVLAAGPLLLVVVKKAIERECEELTGSPCEVDAHQDPGWGCVYEVAVDANAREALEANLKLQEKFPGAPIFVEWAGEKDVADEELVDYLVKILKKGGFRAKAPPGFDAVEAVREGRESRCLSGTPLPVASGAVRGVGDHL